MNNDVIIELKNSISGESSKDGKLVEDIQIIPNLQNIFLDVNEENKIDEIDDNMSAITIESNIKNNSLEENILEENILEENILEENILVEEKSLAEENILVEEKSMAEEKSLAEETLDPPVTLANSPEKKKRVYKPRKK